MIPHPDFQSQLREWFIQGDFRGDRFYEYLVYVLNNRSDDNNQWAWEKLQEGLQASLDKSNNKGNTPEDQDIP